MTGKKATSSAKVGKGKRLNQTSLLDLFSKKPNTVKRTSTTSAAQVYSRTTDLEDLDSDKQRSSPVAIQELAAVAISVEPASPKASTSKLPPLSQQQPIYVGPEIINLVDDHEPESPLETMVGERRLSDRKSELGTREDNPIVVLDSSPVKHTKLKSKASITKKETYSIFTPWTQKPQKSTLTPTSYKASTSLYTEAPYPSRDLQHVHGPQSDFPYPPTSTFTPRPKMSLPSQESVTYVYDSLQIPLNPNEQDSHDEEPQHRRPAFTPASPASIRSTHLSKSIPPYHRSHPAISHLTGIASAAELPAGDFGNRLWTDKWRPRRADHVLYNENHTLYLRDWLSALELQLDSPPLLEGHITNITRKGTNKGKAKAVSRKDAKRQRVVRAVDKASRKKRKVDSDEDDDWIVSDHYVEEDIWSDGSEQTEREDGDTTEQGRRIRRRVSDVEAEATAQSRPIPRHTFNDRLTNTILLSGPCGSGKTAAVYACADELGWEVFEVYPGIGRRNGANLDNLVGDVGKNHLVRKTHGMHRDKEHESPIKSHFARDKRREKHGEVDEGAEEGAQIVDNRYRSPSTDFGFMEQPPNILQVGEMEASRKLHVRQSLILLEEVDILYHDDTNFWPAVIGLIKECKRPVVLTCNDISLVPTADLPLQDIRQFEPCPVPVATSFLQALCCAEGYIADKNLLSTLCASNSDYHANTDEFRLDLRRAIQNLQLCCPHSEGAKNVDIPIWERIPRKEVDLLDWTKPTVLSTGAAQGERTRRHHTELLSFSDCHLIRSTNDSLTLTSLALEGNEGTNDDVLGHRVVVSTNTCCFGDNYDRDEMIMSTAISLSRGEENDESGARDPFLRGVRYEELVRELQNNGAVSMSERYRQESFNMDYLPWIRIMMRTDDEQEMEMERMKKVQQREGRRTTRNSQKAQHVRTILVNYTERKGMKDSELGLCELES
ncbi:P-loop containing nucleoside triphosphate hydrolase protein [Marasmius fiardii PR-910]|nr:P-loop containing nucleoside triphosphate hydrolase protein [Marasmius fiardii PR-910]